MLPAVRAANTQSVQTRTSRAGLCHARCVPRMRASNRAHERAQAECRRLGPAHICAGTGPHLRRDSPHASYSAGTRRSRRPRNHTAALTIRRHALVLLLARSYLHGPTCTVPLTRSHLHGPTYPTVAKMGISRPRAFVRSTRLLSVSIHASAPHARVHTPAHPRTHHHHHHHHTFRCAPSNVHATAHNAADYCTHSLAR